MFEKRLKVLQKSLNPNKIYGLLISGAVNIAYLTGYSIFSRREREAYLFVAETNIMLFTDGRYIEGVRTKLPKGVRVFLHTELFKKVKASRAKKVGIEHNFTVAELKKFRNKTGKKFVLVEQIVENLRAVKDPEEIKNIKAACRLTDKTFKVVRKLIKTGVTEKEIAWKIEKFIKEDGGELAFDPIVAFGPNSAIPHHKTSNKKLTNKDQFVLLDFGAKVNGYCSDMTRTLLTKRASTKARKMYESVQTAQRKVIECINKKWYDRSYHQRSPIKALEVAKIANAYIVSNGFEQIPHGLGHGVGLEVHEEPRISPKSKGKLVRDMIFTIEPGIYTPGFGGVRIEDDYLLSNKLERLTKSPKQIIEI
ncbi:MAG: hypothetical protein A3C30_04670 [Candidatus Levybacteria bacterium RIFCSPHIGHO2_02_FULL_40_18]|nr:MAG: hypothetical protein A2869_02325 [Candidatus Levybacteria bacterium RIFCSPHIGHO2_01_FULL_40_58]OGH26372.1 MAG: hypothetical protein A3C30_04670 [Candidatus Levybacteria bacterium RIFCSPHIGHO2_02_FULL_40_18]OGH31819.1 MAG: hypothetical protein A3E43_00465 [Candidatus Levybacteria bacterium RIFCSPHIGHO2_12_FULL_40_31]OGH40452.1 MAG: hypothetical protein A2894_00970 [Candidatus Levybacteria bacterium RIFCSPLOWO2_01_FULL_40_64]OGH49159.1 MAG: hypothetical protein A3I54_04370 [Candidatus Lev